MAWTSPMIPYFLSEQSHIKMTKNQAEWMESIFQLGAFCGLPVSAYLTCKIGRKRTLILVCSILLIAWVILAVANRVEYLDVSRFLQGFGLITAVVSLPMYLGEISHKSIRGLLSSMYLSLSVIGIVTMYTTGPYLPYYFTSILASAILIIEIVVLAFIPESAYFLTSTGRHDAANKSLKKFRRSSDVHEELLIIRKAIAAETTQNESIWKDLFLVKNYRKSLLIMAVLSLAQLFCCFEAILMNLHEILTAAGSIYVNAATAGILFSLMNLLAATVSSLVIDKFGRVKLLMISTIMTTICLLLLSVYFHLKDSNVNTTYFSWIPIVSVMTFGLVYRLGLGIVPIVLSGELFAPKIKSFGVPFTYTIYVISSFIALRFFFLLRDNFGIYVAFYFFSFCCFLSFLFVSFFIPETKGRSLEEIQKILKN